MFFKIAKELLFVVAAVFVNGNWVCADNSTEMDPFQELKVVAVNENEANITVTVLQEMEITVRRCSCG